MIEVSGRTYMRLQETGELKNIQSVTSTDAAGNVTITRINKLTGEILGKTSIGKVGKPQQAPVSITFPSIDTIVDPATGKPKYVQHTDKKTGEIYYTDITTGKRVSPEEVQIKEPPKPADPLDTFIDDMINEIIGEF